MLRIDAIENSTTWLFVPPGDDDDNDNDYDYDDDYILDVLMGFLGEDVPQSVLPLMINFEAKSITTKFDLLKANMQSRSLTN
jgi:hypothetical protein